MNHIQWLRFRPLRISDITWGVYRRLGIDETVQFK
jgi:hypothetical protein